MGIEMEKERLSQASTLTYFLREMNLAEMVTVYYSDAWKKRESDRGIYCALVPSTRIEQVLSEPSWSLTPDQGLPGAVEYFEGDNERVKYLRFGNENGIEPLIIHRNFYGIRPSYPEICEEFRHFHRLYHDRNCDQYIKIDGNGEEKIVAVVEPRLVKIRLKEIRQFLAIKEMHLAIQFDCKEWSRNSLKELKLPDALDCRKRVGLAHWQLSYNEWQRTNLGGRSISRLLGMRLIKPLPKQKSGFPGFANGSKREYVDFVVGMDQNGDDIVHTCNPDVLSNFFGANPSAPAYLTPVDFRKDVLDKYYHRPALYEIADGILKFGSIWHLNIDNFHEDKVTVWLGDLGKYLPHEEQLHWRSYNSVSGTSVSTTHFDRQILAEPTQSDRPEHVFLRKYRELAKTSQEHLGWPLLRSLEEGDQHHLRTIRIPATDERRDFDELVLGLTKILIDSLNYRFLSSLIPSDQRECVTGSISRLEVALSTCGIDDATEHMSFLRNLQDLRSAGSAHRKGREYRKVARRFELDRKNLRTVFNGILQQAVEFLDYLIGVAQSQKLTRRNGQRT